jgi:hypothetical protein
VRILETLAKTLREEKAHPTTVLNALINLENQGGLSAVHELEYRLACLVRAMRERDDHTIGIAVAWLEAARAYIETFTPAPGVVKATFLDALRRLGVRQ